LGNDSGNKFGTAKCVVIEIGFGGEFTESATFRCAIDAYAASPNWSIWRGEKPYLRNL
jgi:hypothetical protein